LTSCEKPDVIEDHELLNSLCTNSLDTIKIRAINYVLGTDMSCNLMPGGPITTKRPLIALIFLVDLDSLPIMVNINIRKLYVIKYQLIWVSNPVDYNQPH
jgi:hypothetical protein